MIDDPVGAGNNQPSAQNRRPKKRFMESLILFKERLHIWPRHWPDTRKRVCTVILLVVIAAILGGLGYLWYHQSHKPKPKKVVVKTVPVAPASTTVASRLTGAQIDPSLNQRHVTAIMIENSPDARPQSGLLDAGIVFEAVAEGGITRFMALYMESQPNYIGPIRSSRPYYLDWMMPFDAAYAHAGGSPEALADIKTFHIKDLDEFANGDAYQRVNTRFAPHNLYSSMDQLYQLANTKGWQTSDFTGFQRKAEAPAKGNANASVIDLNISSQLYNPHFEYNGDSNTYYRSEGGQPHIDERSGKQLNPKVVVVLVTPSALESDGTHNSYQTVGAGPMYVFQDGTVAQGTWKKSARTSQFEFIDSTGQPLKLNPGQTWISLVNQTSDITYK